MTCEPRGRPPGAPYVVVIIVDVTERHLMQTILERTVAERTSKLRETVQELEDFSHSIAHDMRAPLRAMQELASLFLAEYGQTVPDQGKVYLDRIMVSAIRLEELIQDVLQYSQVARRELPLKAVDLEELLAQVIESYPNLQGPDVKIEVVKPLARVEANPAALTQVFSNLLGNAVKFIEPGQAPSVKIWSEAADGKETAATARRIRVWVEDNGIGIEKAAQERLFQMFQRLNPAELYEGTGIGLAIVKKAVERMGGEVGVVSERGRGSRFWVELNRAGSGV